MGDTRTMRASDRDRQDVVDRLRSAVGDGRLRMDEYMERMERAYEAVTYRDLAPLHEDLPASGSPASGSVAETGHGGARPPGAASAGSLGLAWWPGFRVVLRVLWAIMADSRVG